MSTSTHTTTHDGKAPTMGVFFSPPEVNKGDTFRPAESSRGEAYTMSNPLWHSTQPSFRSMLPPLSPPISPATKDDKELGPKTESQHIAEISDPQLFPESKSEQADTTSPLFRPAETVASSGDSSVIESHIRARNAQGRSSAALPSKEDYSLAISFRQRVTDRYNADPVKYFDQELSYLDAYPPRWATKVTVPSKSAKRKAEDEVRLVKRQRQAPKALVEKLPAPKRAPRTSPREAPVDDFGIEPVVKHRRKVSRATPTPREDMDYRNVPDYSPAISTMAPGKNLKIDWKGHPLDLSDDPDKHLLDDHEVTLASVLRLTAAQYLFAKRKIFERYIELTRKGSPFNKTSAQAVCKIDVNKASKLWTAFEKVGWFDRRHFSEYL